jgi:hypothetical protein
VRQFLAATAFLFDIALLANSSVQAGCICRCENSQLRTICTDPLDNARCAGACFGDRCLGFCRPNFGVAEQNRIETEARTYQFRHQFRARTPSKSRNESHAQSDNTDPRRREAIEVVRPPRLRQRGCMRREQRSSRQQLSTAPKYADQSDD